MAAESLSGSDGEMVATYAVSITGIQRTKAELAKVSLAISSLRQARYSPGTNITVSQARFGASRGDRMVGKNSRGTGEDIFASPIIELEGRIQTVVSSAMAHSMSEGKKMQAAVLRAAVTDTGKAGGARNGPGRDKTGKMIGAIRTNVETQKAGDATKIVGWHGWAKDRDDYFKYQEQGSKGRASGQSPIGVQRKVKKRTAKAKGLGVPAANSLGVSIVVARENLKNKLRDLKK